MKVLVTGHGGFASGMAAASRMIVGDQELIDWLPFEEGTNLSDYQAQIAARVERHGEEGLLILTDFKGGTPFNVSMLLSILVDKIDVAHVLFSRVIALPFAH